MSENGQGPQKRETEFHGTKKPGQFGERNERAASAVELEVQRVDDVISDIDTQIDALSARRAADKEVEFTLGALAVTAIVKAKYPNAAVVELHDVGDGDEGIILQATTIYNADETVAWDDEEYNDESVKFLNRLSNYTPLLDSIGLSNLELPLRDGENRLDVRWGIEI